MVASEASGNSFSKYKENDTVGPESDAARHPKRPFTDSASVPNPALHTLPKEILTNNIGKFLNPDERHQLSNTNRALHNTLGAPLRNAKEALDAISTNPIETLKKIKRGELFNKELLDSPTFMLIVLESQLRRDLARNAVNSFNRDLLAAMVDCAGPSVLGTKKFVLAMSLWGEGETIDKVLNVMGTNLFSDRELMFDIAEWHWFAFLKNCALAHDLQFMLDLLANDDTKYLFEKSPEKLKTNPVASNKTFMTKALKTLSKSDTLHILDKTSPLARDPEFLWLIIDSFKPW